ncbi:MAG TPA: hypothetical protein VMV20_03910 [Chitinophagaceae bacterium]|nr:hypothetical protein [Chitinophagaceae bacterium]
MKRNMLLLFFLTLLFSCTKETPRRFQNEGVITGINAEEFPCKASCPCGAGGVFFHFTDTSYTADIIVDNPQIFNLAAGSHFPVRVMVDWQNTSRCGITAIKITQFMVVGH